QGQILIFDGARILPEPFLDIRPQVLCCGERGLLGLAFHPQYGSNGFFYVYYVDFNEDAVIARYTVSDDPDVAKPSSRVEILTISHRESGAHYSGELVFGPDGFLYIGTGDGELPAAPGSNAQDLDSLLGKILRIDVDHGRPYALPAMNPFASREDARPEIWSYGLRNPWRFSFDRVTGDLWIADVGQTEWEEINLQPASSRGGENYGWERMEGPDCRDTELAYDEPHLTEPVLFYSHDAGTCSVIGGFRYRGSRYPRLQGTYVYGDFCTGTIWGALDDGNGHWRSRVLLEAPIMISSFGEDSLGELYVVDYRGGQIFRIEDAAALRRRAVGR
ncbi:MAG TPA: PQQ-dependent sugar dehydrogenase, partial [Thermoanaerobaculia bacterium]|nr:PQQ-dependent sugar dehydrogenase [Thermoanaerobaculia bacterium]